MYQLVNKNLDIIKMHGTNVKILCYCPGNYFFFLFWFLYSISLPFFL